MARFLQALQNPHFVSGALWYEDTYFIGDPDRRIVITAAIGDGPIIRAIIDTGAYWCVLDPEIVADVVETAQDTIAVGRRLVVRGTLYNGRLVLLPIRLMPDDGSGQSIEIEATVFVPDRDEAHPWPHPNFIGLSLLERMRFAVDPDEQMFYYGALV